MFLTKYKNKHLQDKNSPGKLFLKLEKKLYAMEQNKL